MIAHVQGRIVRTALDHVVVDVNGVGYRVLIPASTRERLPPVGRDVFLHTSLQVREDSLSLYGFLTAAELELFEALLSVSGIGPRVALGILSAASPDQVRQAIATEDTAFLTRLPQVGRKLAQRLVLELRDRLAGTPAGGATVPAGGVPEDARNPQSRALADAVEALVGLGYSRPIALRALEEVRPAAGQETVALVRLALRWLGRQAW